MSWPLSICATPMMTNAPVRTVKKRLIQNVVPTETLLMVLTLGFGGGVTVRLEQVAMPPARDGGDRLKRAYREWQHRARDLERRAIKLRDPSSSRGKPSRKTEMSSFESGCRAKNSARRAESSSDKAALATGGLAKRRRLE